MAIAEDLAVIHDPLSAEPFHVEQHGIDFIPPSERWARPRDIFGMWAGASMQVEYFIYGCILMSVFRFTFIQAVSLIIIGNLSYFLLGLCSLQGPQTRDDRLRHQPGQLWTERRPADLLLQLDDADRIRGRGPDPHRRGRSGAHHQSRLLLRRPGQGDPGRRRRADSGDPAVPRACGDRQDAPFPGHPVRRPLRHPPGFRHPARTRSRRAQRRLADLHRGPGLHHRPERPGMDRVRERLHAVLPRRHVEEGHRGMGLPGYCGTRDPHHDVGRCRRDVRGRDRSGHRRLPSPGPPEHHPGVVRRGLHDLRGAPTLLHQQPRHVLVGSHLAGDRGAGEALASRDRRLCHRAGCHDVRRLQLVLLDLPERLRRCGHRLDRSLVGHLRGRLDPAPLPLRRPASCRRQAATASTGARGGCPGLHSSPR